MAEEIEEATEEGYKKGMEKLPDLNVARDAAGKDFNVSGRYVDDAKKLKIDEPELL